MRYAMPQYFESKARFLSYTVVHHALVGAGHEVVEDIDASVDAVLFSMCDVTEYPKLRKMYKRANGIPLIVGGAYAFNFWSAALYSDGVWVGEVYEMAECRTIDELLSSPHCYTGGDRLPTAAQRIDWDRVPIAQISPTKCYYWGGAGCKNRCRFCFTSWTHRHSVNDPARIRKAQEIAKAKKLHIMVASNEYENDPGAKTFDMMLVDYVRTPVKASSVRMGVEFATEDVRARCGKAMSDNDIFHALQKAQGERVSLKLFHITGYEPLDDWERYIDKLGLMAEQAGYNKLLWLGFNNLQYQNYTPMYAARKSIDPERYIDIRKTREWYDRLRQHMPSVLVGAPSTFQHVACRMGVELARDRAQVDYWLSMMAEPNRKLSKDGAYSALIDSGVLDTPPLMLNPNTGEIKIHEPWR